MEDEGVSCGGKEGNIVAGGGRRFAGGVVVGDEEY